jgi:TP901 family phage tail tape measure protein
MGQAGQVFVNFGANTQGLLAGTARAGNILQKFSQTGMGAAIVLGASFITLSRTMTNFVSSSVNGFKEFDFQITRAKALSGATTEEFIKMRDVASELGRITEWSAKDAAEGMANLALSGFNTNEIMSIIPESLRLATAGGVNLAKTNTIMANAMRSFGLEADQANQVSNVLTATFSTTNTTLESLAQTIKVAAGVLGIVGVKIEEVAAAAGVLGDVGISASVAGTGLKNFGIKLAKTFGVVKDASKSSKEFFENLGITKDRLFDATNGTFDMVEATIAFKEAMDKLGKARAPEFLAQFSTLFGERNAVSLSALVKKAEQFKIQSQNVRMTEMVGDVKQIFQELKNMGNETAYMDNIQEGLNNSIKTMVGSLADANSYMEEFNDSGDGAVGVITRMSKSFRTTQKVLEDTFSKDVFGKTRDGLITVNEYSKTFMKEMVRYDEVLKELATKGIGKNRVAELEKEKLSLEKLMVAGTKDISQLTDQGRARLINLASLKTYIDSMEQSKDGTSKAANQLETLNTIFKGNTQNVAMAARAFGIHIDKNIKMTGSLQNISREMDKLVDSADSQKYAMQRLASQTALTNTSMDMQAIQLETLHGVFEILSSNVEQVSNQIAKALSPAIVAVTSSVSSFIRIFTLSRDEIDKGVTAMDTFRDAWRESIQIFTQGEGVFARLKESFRGLSSIGKTVALVMGTFGAAGLAAGGAFIWVQALLPALSALSTIFMSIVVPVSILIGIAIKLGFAFKSAYDQAKLLGDIVKGSVEDIVGVYNNTEGVINGFRNSIDLLDAQMIKVFSKMKESISKIGDEFNGLIGGLEKIVGLTNMISVTGGKLTFFDSTENIDKLENSLNIINNLMDDLGNISSNQKEKIRAAIRSGDSSMINKSLKETKGLIEEMGKVGINIDNFTNIKDSIITMRDPLNTINKLMTGLNISKEQQENIRAAIRSGDSSMINKSLKETKGLMDAINVAGLKMGFSTEVQQKTFRDINSSLQGRKEILAKIQNDISKEQSMNDKSQDSINKILALKKEEFITNEGIKELENKRKKIMDDIVNGNGRAAKLTNREIDDLKRIERLINQRSISVGKLKGDQLSLLELQKKGINITEKLNEVTTNLKREHSLLVDNQKEYNKILNDAADSNPFIVLMRAMKEIAKSDMVKKSILAIGTLVADTVQYISNELVPRIINISSILFNMIKNGTSGTLTPILRLIKTMGGLIGDVVKYSLDTVGTLFQYISNDSGKIRGSISKGINGISDMIDRIRTKIEPFMTFISVILIALYDTIKSIIITVGPSVINLVKSLGNLFSSVFGAIGMILEDVFGKIEGKGIDVLGLIAVAINKVAGFINTVANAIKNADTSQLEKMGVIGLAIAAAFMIVSKVLAFIPIAMAQFNSLMSLTSTFSSNLKKMFTPLLKGKDLFTVLGNVAKGTLAFISGNLLLLSGILAGVIVFIGSLSEAWKKNFGNIQGATKGLVGSILGFFKTIFESAWGLITDVMGLVGSIMKVLFNIGKTLAPFIGPIIALVMNVVSIIINIISGIIKIVVGIVRGLIQTIKTILDSEFVSTLINTIIKVTNMIYDVITGIINVVKWVITAIMDKIKPLTDFIGNIVKIIAIVISDLLSSIWNKTKEYFTLIVSIFTNIFKFIGGFATVISGIFTLDIDKIRNGLSIMFDAISTMFIKVYEFIAEIIGKIIGLAVEGFTGFISFVIEKLAQVFSFIPGIGKSLSETMSNLGKNVSEKGKEISAAIMGGVAGSVSTLEGEAAKIVDKINGAKNEAENKSNGVFAKESEAKEKFKKAGKTKAEKEQDIKQQGIFTLQEIKKSSDDIKNNTSAVKELAAKVERPNITNQTYVEYRAAEDDEVNRRMIERVMNDILKSDIGSMMGDTASM